MRRSPSPAPRERVASAASRVRALPAVESGSAAPGEEAVVFKAGFAVGERGACQRLDAASSSLENSLPGSRVPLHRRAEARVEVGLTGSDDAEFQGAATALTRSHWITFQKLGE